MKQFLLLRLRILEGVFILIFIIFAGRLAYLQIYKYEYYSDKAKLQHERKSVLPARRGKILVRKNRLSDEYIPLATNTTLKMLAVDPVIMNYPDYKKNVPLADQERSGDPIKAAQILAPLLINSHCSETEGCTMRLDSNEWTPEEKQRIALYEAELTKIFTTIETQRRVIAIDLAPSRLESIQSLQLIGVYIEGKNVIVNPTKIADTVYTAAALAPILDMDTDELEPLLKPSLIRYKEITNKILPDISDKIDTVRRDNQYRKILSGIVLKDEHWRYYPEKKLAAQIIGYTDNEGIGRYGIEERFDQDLKGKEGAILGAVNTSGQHLLANQSTAGGVIKPQDGADIILSIDRVVQGTVEKILEEDLKKYDADAVQAIIIEPSTGRIIAMAQAPNFDPNRFGDVFLTYPITPDQETLDRSNKAFNQKIPTTTIDGELYRYANTWGPEVLRNKAISDLYEPGSVMKAITMAAAINTDEVGPSTTFYDSGPVKVDEFEIKNSDNMYLGTTSMIQVINRSLNTGIAFIIRKMGAQVWYEYLKAFGFGQYTDIKLPGETPSQLPIWHNWAESELVTRGFGQGISATPLQMVMAFSALANGGYLMKPIIVDEVRYSSGRIEDYKPEIVRRAVSEETYLMVKAMLAENVKRGFAETGKVDRYTVMGKTGTSQTYDERGKARTGAGTTIGTYAGFGPFDNPQFVILVKYDYPKTTPWGSETAGPTFKRIAEFMFQYLDIPPEK